MNGPRPRSPRALAAAGWVLRRLGTALATALAASALIWALLPLAPGDPAARYLQARDVLNPTAEELALARTELGLDRPLVVQFASWLADAARGDLGRSFDTRRPVLGELGDRFPATLRLALLSVAFGIALTVPLGLLAAAYAGRPLDAAARAFSVFGYAVPSFVVGLVVLQVVVLALGRFSVIADTGWRGAVLPAGCLAIASAAHWSRLLRAGLLSAERSAFGAVSRARGATRLRVLVVHALPNATVPLLTAVALSFGFVLGGAAVLETVFSRPGLGQYLVERIQQRDLPAIQAFTLLATVGFVALNLAVDVAAGVIDPRTRARRAA